MQTLEQVLEQATKGLQESLNDMYPETKPAGRFTKAGEGTFDQWAGIAGDNYCALSTAGELPDPNAERQSPYGPYWPQFLDHYYPEYKWDGQWEMLDWQGPYFLYVGSVFDPVTCKTQHYVWTFTYSNEYGCEFAEKIAIENPYKS